MNKLEYEPVNKWDQRMINMADHVATWSKDPHCKVGALIVSPDYRNVSWGYNGLPRGIEYDRPEIANCKDTKNTVTVHAELNALLNCPFDTKGMVMYVTKFPCCSRGCAQAIVQAGITRLVAPEPSSASSWYKDQLAAESILRECKVKVVPFRE